MDPSRALWPLRSLSGALLYGSHRSGSRSSGSRSSGSRPSAGRALLACLVCLAAAVSSETARGDEAASPDLDPVARTTWRPVGCRAVSGRRPVLATRDVWRGMHADSASSDEISIAVAPRFEMDFVAEPDTFNPTGPVFDRAGNLYLSPLIPNEPVVLISLDPRDGSRRFAVSATTDAPAGATAPLVLRDPRRPGRDLVYVALYDRAIAVETDGTIVWDRPTGLTGDAPTAVLGVQYVPSADAIVAVTSDGLIYALDRATGDRLLDAPFSLPGSRAPFTAIGPPLPPVVQDCVDAENAKLTRSQRPAGGGLILGGGVEVANSFSVDPSTGRLFVAATAPDGADGTVDGVSRLGALYGLDLVERAGRLEIAQRCQIFFVGGSASTPALRQDGSRVYVADAVGSLIALDGECAEQWRLDVGAQINGSVAVSSDSSELYVSTANDVFQVFDRGDRAERGFTAALDVFDVPEGAPLLQRNLQITSIAANGVGVQVGLAPTANPGLVFRTAVAVLDRATGRPRGAAEGLDESVAVMSAGPDGAYYLGNSPRRRVVAACIARSFPRLLPEPVAPVVGGITKYGPVRRDLLVRDAICAASDRARNAARVIDACPDSARADVDQIHQLVRQAGRVAVDALAEGALGVDDLTRAWRAFARPARRGLGRTGVGGAQRGRADGLSSAGRRLSHLADRLERACVSLER